MVPVYLVALSGRERALEPPMGAVLEQTTRAIMPGVGLMVRVAGFGSEGPEFKSSSAVELIPGGVNSTCHPSEVG